MIDLSSNLQKQLRPILLSGDVVQCEQAVVAALAAVPASPFHCLLSLSIENSPAEVAAYFDEFFALQPPDKIKAAYTEMNGFDINPDLWYCSPFAYAAYGGHDDYDWLANWQSDDFDILPIVGLEKLQGVYASEAFRDKQHQTASDVASLLLVVRFQSLIQRAAPLMKGLRFPLLSTAHDYDFIAEARPAAQD
jgi:hypothetical protein